MIITFLLEILMILLAIAFFTLMERKLLGYSHFRMGPNKIGVMGIFQPFSDALKLFSKENSKMSHINFFIYFFAPIIGIFIMMSMWFLIPLWGENISSGVSVIFYFCLASVTIYFLVGTGWSSGSKYSVLGSYRSVAQAVSYEVNIFLIVFSLSFMIQSFSFFMFSKIQTMITVLYLPLLVMWLIICLAESNRTPFDFSEGESELVSGFNTEYNGGLFSLIFITEYGFILFFSLLTVLLFLSLNNFSLKLMIVGVFYVWVRSTLPRLRYDRLMLMSWKGILPFVMSFMIIMMSS